MTHTKSMGKYGKRIKNGLQDNGKKRNFHSSFHEKAGAMKCDEKKVKKQKCPLKLFRQTVVDDVGEKKTFLYIKNTCTDEFCDPQKKIHFSL